jgi:hypothetical protein
MAARIYDYFAIISHGLKAKTNYSYTTLNLIEILEHFDAAYIIDPNKSIELATQLSRL